jgi:hypothetical protein
LADQRPDSACNGRNRFELVLELALEKNTKAQKALTSEDRRWADRTHFGRMIFEDDDEYEDENLPL